MSDDAAPTATTSTAKWAAPSPPGAPASVAAMGTVAAPLLAGFSVTFVTLTVQDPGAVRYPALVMLGGTICALAMLTSVQCAFAAQRYVVTPDELASYYRDIGRDLHDRQWAYEKVRRIWSARAAVGYNIGLVAFMAAVALLLVPKTQHVAMPGLRWAAVALAAVGLLGEVAWWSLNGLAGHPINNDDTRRRRPRLDALFPTFHSALNQLEHDRSEHRDARG